MQTMRALLVMGALSFVLGMATEAQAAVAGKTYIVYAGSTVSGEFLSGLRFSPVDANNDGDFFLLAEDGSVAAGTYSENLGGLLVNALGTDGSYVGRFTALSVGPLLVGSGFGTVGDAFIFFGLGR